MDSNGINNFKGVMLCSRPNENPGPVKKDVFCARVVPAQQLGLVPTKKYDEIKVRKKKNPVLNKHMKWLEHFKAKIAAGRDEAEEMEIKELEKQIRIKQQAQKERTRLRMGVSQVSQNSQTQQQAQSNKKPEAQAKAEAQTEKKHRPHKHEKPAWAQTQQEIQKKQEDEANELLDFFNNTDIDKYIDEVEVNSLLSALKNKIQEIKTDKDWKENNRKKIKQQAKPQQQNDDTDKKTEVSKGSVSKSVASQKTTQRIEQLKEKLEKKGNQEWDRYTQKSKNSHTNIEEKIAKNVADDLLRNYGNLKGIHSNVSIRKLLEREAARQLADNTEQTKQNK